MTRCCRCRRRPGTARARRPTSPSSRRWRVQGVDDEQGVEWRDRTVAIDIQLDRDRIARSVRARCGRGRRVEVADERHGELVAEAAYWSLPNGTGVKGWLRYETVPVRGLGGRRTWVSEIRKYHSAVCSTSWGRAIGHPQADVVDAVLVHVGGHRPFASADEAEVDRRVDVPSQPRARPLGQVEVELVVLPRGQVVEAVAVEVADDRVARRSRSATSVSTWKSWFVSKYHVVPVNRPTSSPLAALPSKLPATGRPLMLAGSTTSSVGHAVVVGVDQPAELPADAGRRRPACRSRRPSTAPSRRKLPAKTVVVYSWSVMTPVADL